MAASRRNGRLLLGRCCRRMLRRSGGCQKAAPASAAAKAANEGSCGDEQAGLAMCLSRWQRAVGGAHVGRRRDSYELFLDIILF